MSDAVRPQASAVSMAGKTRAEFGLDHERDHFRISGMNSQGRKKLALGGRGGGG